MKPLVTFKTPKVIPQHMNKNLSWILVGLSIFILLVLQFFIIIPKSLIPLFAVITFALSIFIIAQASNYTIYSIQDYANKTRLPHFLVGFVILAIVTMFPDIFAGVFASQSNQGELIIGDILTGVLVGLMLLVAITAIIAKKVEIKEEEVKGSTPWLILGLALLPLLLFADGQLNRPEAILLLVVFGIYLLFITRKEVQMSHIVKSVAFRSIWQDIIIFGINLSVIILGARWLIISSQILAATFSLSPFVIGFILIAFGNSIPEIMFTVNMARKKVTDMSLGNAFGSVLVNVLLVWGIAALVRPLNFSHTLILSYVSVWLIMLGMTWMLHKKNYLTRREGIIMLVAYLVFTILNLIFNQ